MTGKLLAAFAVAGVIATQAAHAQTVEECREVTALVEDQVTLLERKTPSGVDHIRELLQQAENAAAKGNGERCMKLAQEAKRIADRG